MKNIYRTFILAAVLAFAFPAFAENGTLVADGDTKVVQLIRPHVHLSGDFGGGTLTVYFKDANGAWRAIAGAAYTTATDITLDFERPVQIKGTLASSTAPALIWSID